MNGKDIITRLSLLAGLLVLTQGRAEANLMQIMRLCADVPRIPTRVLAQHQRECRARTQRQQLATRSFIEFGNCIHNSGELPWREQVGQVTMASLANPLNAIGYFSVLLAKLRSHVVTEVACEPLKIAPAVPQDPEEIENCDPQPLAVLDASDLRQLTLEDVQELFSQHAVDGSTARLAYDLTDQGFKQQCLHEIDPHVIAYIFMQLRDKHAARRRLYAEGYTYKVAAYRGWRVTKLLILRQQEEAEKLG